MIKNVYVINDRLSLFHKLYELGLPIKRQWYKDYVFLPKTDYYRLVVFDNGNYSLFTQSQLPIVEEHQELNSYDWKDYKPYADKDYKVMKDNGVEAGTKTNNSWTSIKKNEFRNSEKWNNFRNNILEWNTNHKDCIICEDCKNDIPANLIEIHHIFPNEYDSLYRKKFMLLCHDCHKRRTANGE